MNFKLRWSVSDLGSLPINALPICLGSLQNLSKNRARPSVSSPLRRRDLFHLHRFVSMISSSETAKLLLYSSFDMLSPTDQLSLLRKKTLLPQPSLYYTPAVPDLPDLELKYLSTAGSHILGARNGVPLQFVSHFSLDLHPTDCSPSTGRSVTKSSTLTWLTTMSFNLRPSMGCSSPVLLQAFPLVSTEKVAHRGDLSSPEPPPPPDPPDPPDAAACYYPVKTGILHPLVLNEYFIFLGLFPFCSMCFFLESTGQISH